MPVPPEAAVTYILEVGALLHSRGWHPVRTGVIDDHAFHWWFPHEGRDHRDCTMITAVTARQVIVLPAEPGPAEVKRYASAAELAGDLDEIESW